MGANPAAHKQLRNDQLSMYSLHGTYAHPFFLIFWFVQQQHAECFGLGPFHNGCIVFLLINAVHHTSMFSAAQLADSEMVHGGLLGFCQSSTEICRPTTWRLAITASTKENATEIETGLTAFGIELFYDFRKSIRRAAFDWMSGFFKHDQLTGKHSDFDEESINIHRHPSKRAPKTPSTCQRSKTTRDMMNSKPLDCTLSSIAIVVRS